MGSKKVKDIIQVSAYYPPHLGGQEYVVRDLSRQLVEAGYRVQVVTSAAVGARAGTEVEDGVLVRRMRCLVFGHAPIMLAFPVELFRLAKPDTVVHLHIGQAFTPEMVWLISKLRHFRYIAELHIDFEPSGPAGVLLPLYKQLILKRVLQSAESVVTLNRPTLHTVREVYGYTGPAHIMHNGVDERYFTVDRPPLKAKAPDVLNLLFVGRFSKQKNLPALLKALSLTKRTVHLDLVGEGEERAEVKKLIADYKLTNVTLHGRQDRDQVMAFYKSCDALIMPSLYEAQPLVLLEALAAGIPIIGTNAVGVKDHIKGAGIIVDPTPEGIAQGIEQYYKRYPVLQIMVDWGQTIADKFRWQNTLKEYEGLYETVVGD
jgi:glycosyltransferase involved in cell wall biosynthesis